MRRAGQLDIGGAEASELRSRRRSARSRRSSLRDALPHHRCCDREGNRRETVCAHSSPPFDLVVDEQQQFRMLLDIHEMICRRRHVQLLRAGRSRLSVLNEGDRQGVAATKDIVTDLPGIRRRSRRLAQRNDRATRRNACVWRVLTSSRGHADCGAVALQIPLRLDFALQRLSLEAKRKGLTHPVPHVECRKTTSGCLPCRSSRPRPGGFRAGCLASHEIHARAIYELLFFLLLVVSPSRSRTNGATSSSPSHRWRSAFFVAEIFIAAFLNKSGGDAPGFSVSRARIWAGGRRRLGSIAG